VNKNDRYLIFGAGLLAIYWFATKSRALAGLVFSPGSIQNIYLTGGQPVAELTVMAQNTNSAGLEMNSFAGSVFSGNTYVGNVYNFIPIVIPANSMVPIPVKIQFQISGLVNEIINAYTNGNYRRDISIQGSANVNGFQLPIKADFPIGS